MSHLPQSVVDRLCAPRERLIEHLNIMLKVGGKSFRCKCGCNVFNKPEPYDEPELYECNSCGQCFEAE